MTLSSQKIGYFLASQNTNQTRDTVFDTFSSLVAEVGYEAIKLDNLSSSDLESLDILWAERPFYGYNQSNSRANTYLNSAKTSIAQFVDDGGTLIYNDWTIGIGGGVDPLLTSNLPDYFGPNVVPWSLGRNVDIADDEIANADDLDRYLNDSSLDGGFYTNHGTVPRDQLSNDIYDVLLTDSSSTGSWGILSDSSGHSNDEVISFAYESGDFDSNIVFTSVPVAGILGLDTSRGYNYFEAYSGPADYSELKSNTGTYVKNLIDFVDQGSVTKDLVFSHRLLEADGSSEADGFTVSSFGTEQDKSRRYILELNVHNKAGNGLNLNSFDFTLGFDAASFLDIDYSDIEVSSDFKYFNRASIDNTSGTIRVSAASSEEFQGGSGIADGVNSAVFRVSLDLDDDSFSSLNDLPSLSFNVSANDSETIFLKDDVLNSSDVSIKTLGDIGGSAVVGLADDPYSMDWQDTVQGNPVQLLKATRDEAVFGTQRSIGSSAFTNLIRRGSSLSSSISDSFVSTGDSSATSARFKATRTDDYFGADLQFKLTHTKSKLGFGHPNRVTSTDDYIDDYQFGSNDSEAIETGTLLGNGTRRDDGDVVRLDYLVNVVGAAGDILDTSKIGVEVSAAGGYRTTHYLGSSKNLITFQSDVNYDGRVSMADLAFVNAGASLRSSNLATEVSDVDINYDGEITIDDLQILEADWGQSLHDSSSPASFVGSSKVSLDELSSQIIGDSSLDWSDDSFSTQNIRESSDSFIGSIGDSGSSSVVIGISPLNSHISFEGRYDDLQDSLG